MDSQRGPNDEPTDQAESDLESDLDALDQFCEEIEHDEITYDEWCHHHKALDLKYHLSVDPRAVADERCIEIMLSRSIREYVDGKLMIRREKCSHSIQLSAEMKPGEQIVLSGWGDQDSGRSGDLHVTIRFVEKK